MLTQNKGQFTGGKRLNNEKRDFNVIAMNEVCLPAKSYERLFSLCWYKHTHKFFIL